jgi:hypothetical protein
MNHGPFNNPLPFQMPHKLRGEPVANIFRRWCEAFVSKSPDVAAAQGNELLMTLRAAGVDQIELERCCAAMESAIRTLNAPQSGCGTDAFGSDFGVDLYEPDPERFYVLDKRSGTELQGILDDLHYTENYLARGAKPPNRLLFVGEPGTGKTAGGLWLGSQLGMTVALIRLDGVIAPKVGETARNLRMCFESAEAKEAIIFIDEFEAVAVNRNDSNPNMGQWNKETTSALLQCIDALRPTTILIGATNIPKAIDGAVLRRMRKHVTFHPPDRDARAEMLKKWWAKAPHHPKAKRALLDATEGLSGDFLERMADEANRGAARRGVAEPIAVHDIETALRSVMPQHGLSSDQTSTDVEVP